jgi:hypothetical protein
MSYIEIEREQLQTPFDEEPPLMTDEEFGRELAQAAEGRGELFEQVSLEDFKHGNPT